MSSRVEAALAECDRCIEACEAGKAGSWKVVREEPDEAWSTGQRETPNDSYPAMLRIGRDVLTRHTPSDELAPLMLHLDADEDCEECSEDEGHLSVVCDGCFPTWDGMDGYSIWPCQASQPWLDLLAPEPTP